VSTAWTTIAALAAGTVAIKSMGPIALGGRSLPPRLNGFIMLLAPSLLAALVAVETFGAGHRLVVDARVAGLVAAAVALALRRSVMVVVVVAALATALTRALT
jgi:branched-subunit amino acid transport protein